MRAQAPKALNAAQSAIPYLWGFAAAAALDYVIDVHHLFLPVMAGAAILSAGCLVLRRAGR